MTSHRPDLYPLATRGFSSTPTFRRQHAAGQPPTLLTTNFAGAQNQHLGIASASQTPLSTTSLSAPFSAYPTSAHPLSPQADFGESSAMATRSRGSFNAPYNPQQWGPLSSSTSSTLDTATRSGQSSQSTRFPRYAPRLVGPDGMLSL
ncbi:MAG: hypothetical protein Q9183_000777 [Haloplaca sp. 2 TL-2023]